MAKSSFDTSLLSPIDDDKNSQFYSQLTPVGESDNAGDITSDVTGDEYFKNMPKPEGFFAKLPRNFLIALAKGGHNTLNLPHDIAQSFENVGSEFDKKINPALPMMPKYQNIKLSDYIPTQQDYDFAGMLGQQGEGTLMDKLIQKTVEYAPEIASGKGILRGAFRRIKGTHQLDQVRDAVNQLGFNNFSFNPQSVAEARRYLPNTEAVRNMVRASQGGNYGASMSLQSQLGAHQRNLAKSTSAAEKLLAPRVGDLKQNMLNQLDDILRSNGMHEEADLLRHGIQNYAQYQRVKNAVMPYLKWVGIPTTGYALGNLIYNKGKNALSSD